MPQARCDPGVKTPRAFWLVVLVAAVLLAAQGLRLANRMVPWTDESAYVHLGYLVVHDRVSLFQDELTGSRMPLPFWIIGASQVVAGRSLLAARITSLALAVVAVILTALVARRLGGPTAGAVAALLFATNGVLVGYLSAGVYHSIAAVILLSGLLVIVGVRQPTGNIIGMAVLSLLFITRTNLWPIIPGVCAMLLWTARGTRERLALLVAAGWAPAVFFATDMRHLKVLAYVPVLNRVVVPLGYPRGWELVDIHAPTSFDRVWAFIRFARMHEFWTIAAAFLLIVIAARFLRQRQRVEMNTYVVALIGLIVYIAAWQVLVLWSFPKAFVAFFPSWSPLVAIVLGVGFASALHQSPDRRALRFASIAVLIVCCVGPTLIIRHPLLPSGADADALPLRDLNSAAEHLRRLIPRGAKVFLWGDSLPVYLADRTPYLRQIHSVYTFSIVDNPQLVEKSGMWGRREMQLWLGTDADYALLEPTIVDEYRARWPARVQELQALLDRNFRLVDRVQDFRWMVFDVYERRRN